MNATTMSWKEYLSFRLCFPFTDTRDLIRVDSVMKTPGMMEFMEQSNHAYYLLRHPLHDAYRDQILEAIHNNEDEDVVDQLVTMRNTQQQLRQAQYPPRPLKVYLYDRTHSFPLWHAYYRT
jgi:hypothetical protein